MGDPDALSEEVETWLASTASQQPLKPRYLDWVHVAPGSVRAQTGALTFATLKESAQTFSATLDEPPDEVQQAGVLTHYKDSSTYRTYLVNGAGQVSVFEVIDGNVRWDNVQRVATEGDWTWHLDHQAHTLSLHDATVPLTDDMPVAAGPAAYDSTVSFNDLTWR